MMIYFLCAIILLMGCSVPPMYNKDYEPPSKGLLPYLQKGSMANFSNQGYSVLLYDAEEIGTGEQVKLLQVLNPNGESVRDFSEDMTKLMHLIVVSRDLQFFSHVHPDYEGEGIFRTALDLPYGGDFLFVTEFIPDQKGITVHKQWVRGEGEPPSIMDLAVSENYVETVGQVEFQLSVHPSFKELRSGEMAMLVFSYRDADTGEPIELEPYLGTGGHCVILDETANQYVHVHAVEGMSSSGSVMFHAEFPAAGIYKLWGQFQLKGEVLVVPFVIQVK
ncbi:hypothetical protein [Paenibacillus sp. NPDC057967]|uniref:hypothetical protein n=1 Tax=Paenibacillus sp. NPDC057967 TaxID=3346293 RepID=UPI0036D7ACFF